MDNMCKLRMLVAGATVTEAGRLEAALTQAGAGRYVIERVSTATARRLALQRGQRIADLARRLAPHTELTMSMSRTGRTTALALAASGYTAQSGMTVVPITRDVDEAVPLAENPDDIHCRAEVRASRMRAARHKDNAPPADRAVP